MSLRLILTFALLLVICVDIFSQQSTCSKNVSVFEIDAPQLHCKKRIWIYLPIGYEKIVEKYPVIYMHDAQNLFDKKTSYAGEWQVDETLDSLKAKIIVVGIEHGGDQRLMELTPFVHPKHGGGKADLYVDFIVKNLKPYIDENYRTKKSAKNTCIFGSSLGGLTSFYAVLKYPKIFGKAGIF